MRTVLPTGDSERVWHTVARAGLRHLNLDARAAGRRYLSLAAVVLTRAEATELARLTRAFTRLLDRAVDGVLRDDTWWSSLAWPWPAIELARLEPPHPGGLASLYGRFDFLLAPGRGWQVIEYNADTPSGGRELAGLEPAIARLHPDTRRLARGFEQRLARTLIERSTRHRRPVHLVGLVSSHSWIEDMAQATWLAGLLERNGQPALVGDINDLDVRRGRVVLRGRPIDALYRFYPVERFYRHAVFASVVEATADGRLLALNGLRGFVAQSKACLAWLWANRDALGAPACELVEQHLPATVMARDAAASELLARGVVKHVNGREGDSVVFGNSLDAQAWEARLLEGGYVVQRTIESPPVSDVVLDRGAVREVPARFACVGGFSVGGQFGGCYTRLDGPVTSARATYVATLRER